MTDLPEAEREHSFIIKENTTGPFDSHAGDGGKYRPCFLLPIHDNTLNYPDTQLGSKRNITVYWDDRLNGLSFLYPCGDIKMFNFNAEQSFNDFIESLITLYDEAKDRSENGILTRRKKELEAKLNDSLDSRVAAESSVQTYTDRIKINNDRLDAAEDVLSATTATFDLIQAEIDALEPKEATVDADPDSTDP